jgi:hypothetical protein
MKHQLYTRTYEGDNGEEVVVIGNRKDIFDPVENLMEAEFVFRNRELTAVNAIRFKTRETTRSRMLAFDDHLDDLAFEPSKFSKIPREAEILADFGVVEPID